MATSDTQDWTYQSIMGNDFTRPCCVKKFHSKISLTCRWLNIKGSTESSNSFLIWRILTSLLIFIPLKYKLCHNEREFKTYHEELNTNTSKYEKYEARDDQHKRYVLQRIYHTLENRLKENSIDQNSDIVSQ